MRSLLTLDYVGLHERANDAYNWPEATIFWISTIYLDWYIGGILLYFCQICCYSVKILYTVLILSIRTDRPEQTVHTQVRSSLIRAYIV